MKLICALAFLLLIIGCNTEKQAAKKVNWLLAHDLMDDECARLFPTRDSLLVKDSIWRDTTVIPGVTLYDTILLKNDSIIYRTKDCPPTKTITVYQTRDSIITRYDGAELARLTSLLQQKDRDQEKQSEIFLKQQDRIQELEKWKIRFFALLGIVLLYTVIRIFVFKKPI